MEKVGIIGVGFVGGAMVRSFEVKGVGYYAYDKYKSMDSFYDCLNTKIVFLCLPTEFCEDIGEYDKSAIIETCCKLNQARYTGVVVIKSTVEPKTTLDLSERFPFLMFVHNPEFLTAATAFEDFHNQSHIVLGKGQSASDEAMNVVMEFYTSAYPGVEISVCTSTESESMKSFVNCFYAMKIQFFNELYLLCQANAVNYERVIELMLKNGWINPMHTRVPGPDGKLSYGGMCFPKDTCALLRHMQTKSTPHAVLRAAIEERNEMRDDRTNVIQTNTMQQGHGREL